VATLLEALQEHCAEAITTPFVWGTSDCTLWAADWVLRATGRDVATDLRGQYTTEFECRRKLRAAGGLQAVVAAALGSLEGFASVEATQDAPAGAIGLVATRRGAACALRLHSGRWACKTSDGLWFTYHALAGWKFKCPLLSPLS
jgi:hypothetical protein